MLIILSYFPYYFRYNYPPYIKLISRLVAIHIYMLLKRYLTCYIYLEIFKIIYIINAKKTHDTFLHITYNIFLILGSNEKTIGTEKLHIYTINLCKLETNGINRTVNMVIKIYLLLSLEFRRNINSL